MATNGTLTARQKRFIPAMLTARTLTEAAALVGIHRRTGEKWLKEPAVKAALAEAQDEALRDTTRRLSAGMVSVLDTLQEIHEDRDKPPSVRVQAAQHWGNFAAKFGELQDLSERVERLEAKINERRN